MRSGDVALKSLADYSAAHPDNKLVKKQYAILLLGFGELAKARAAYEKLVRDNPSDAIALNNLSWLVVKDDPGRAFVLAQRAVKADPSSANNLDTLGSLQMTRSDFNGAVASLKKAHDLAPDNPEISYHLALALEGSVRGEQAQALLQGLVKRGGFSDLDAAKIFLPVSLSWPVRPSGTLAPFWRLGACFVRIQKGVFKFPCAGGSHRQAEDS
jgi:Flp pilus assembly protein TadD